LVGIKVHVRKKDVFIHINFPFFPLLFLLQFLALFLFVLFLLLFLFHIFYLASFLLLFPFHWLWHLRQDTILSGSFLQSLVLQFTHHGVNGLSDAGIPLPLQVQGPAQLQVVTPGHPRAGLSHELAGKFYENTIFVVNEVSSVTILLFYLMVILITGRLDVYCIIFITNTFFGINICKFFISLCLFFLNILVLVPMF